MGCWKAIDEDACDQITNIMIDHANKTMEDNKNGALYQSRNRAFSTMMMISHECKETFTEFEENYNFIMHASNPDYEGTNKNSISPELKAMKVSATADMEAHQKATGKGGGCKVSKHFCMYCTCTSSDLYKPNMTQCSR